jgi:hypothetical protein
LGNAEIFGRRFSLDSDLTVAQMQDNLCAVDQGAQLKTDWVVHEFVARKPCPIQSLLTLLDPLLGFALLVAELHRIAGFSANWRISWSFWQER